VSSTSVDLTAILVLNEITDIVLYHIWKILYQEEFAVVLLSSGAPMDSFPKTLKSPNVASWLEFRRRISCNKKIAVLRELRVWYKTKLQLLIGNTKSEVSGITDFFVRVCKDPLNCVGNCKYL
jgi:hypothetical protein